MQLSENASKADTVTIKQIETIKDYAIALWGDNWLAELCKTYEQKNGYAHRIKGSKVRAWFNGAYLPTLTSFNELLIAIGCEMKIVTIPKEIL